MSVAAFAGAAGMEVSAAEAKSAKVQAARRARPHFGIRVNR